MSRVVDANQAFVGAEPKYAQQITKIELIKALNWYAQNKENKDSEKYASEYFKKHHKIDVSQLIKQECPTFGYVCRLVNNGATLPVENMTWFESKVKQIIKAATDKNKLRKKEKVIDEEDESVRQNNIQTRIAEKISEIIGDLEGAIDDIILSSFKDTPSPKAVMHERTKGLHANKIIEHFKKKRVEFDEALSSKDEQVIEAYSCYTKSQIKKLVQFCDSVIKDAMDIIGNAVKSRKPRKRKAKTPEQLVAKVKYQQNNEELKLTSVSPKDIIGAMQLWVYNTKYRKLGCYHASDSSGLTVKGSTIIGYSEMKSVQKTLRKPEDVLTKVVAGGKVYLRNAIEEIKAVESKLNGRLNEETILLRVIK